jgi:hypothetical protein
MDKKLGITELKNYFSNWPSFTYEDLYRFYQYNEGEISKNLLNTRVAILKKEKIIIRIRSGVYQLGKDGIDKEGVKNPSITNYLVVTGDIIDSKRHRITGKVLETKVRQLNEDMKKRNSGVMPFSSSRGDEFQGVFLIGPEIFDMIRNVRHTFHPVKVRIGLGIGMIEEGGQPFKEDPGRSSWDLNGEAFQKARVALDQLNPTKKSRVLLHSPNSEGNQTFNLVQRLMDTIVGDWSDKQWEAVQLYNQLKSYEAGAKELGISKSSFYQRCSSAKWDILRETENELSHLLVQKYLVGISEG